MSEGEIALLMEAMSTSETLVSFYQTTRRNIPEDNQSPWLMLPLLHSTGRIGNNQVSAISSSDPDSFSAASAAFKPQM
jgi:hypothetical protein